MGYQSKRVEFIDQKHEFSYFLYYYRRRLIEGEFVFLFGVEENSRKIREYFITLIA